MAAPPRPKRTELHTCPQPQRIVQNKVFVKLQPLDFDKAINGI
jgi:hypothetical protein